MFSSVALKFSSINEENKLKLRLCLLAKKLAMVQLGYFFWEFNESLLGKNVYEKENMGINENGESQFLQGEERIFVKISRVV